jgi:hypothetical protein
MFMEHRCLSLPPLTSTHHLSHALVHENHLTLDPDVAALLERVRVARDGSLKDVVNEGLRRGLKQMAEPAKPVQPFRTTTVSLGRCLIGDLDNVAEALAVSEGEDFR